MRRLPSLFIATANSQPWCYAEYVWSVFRNVTNYPGKLSIFRAAHPWPETRNNKAIAQFLKSDCEVFVKMDMDQEYPDDYLITMAPLVEKYKVIGPEIYDRSDSNAYGILCFGDKSNLVETWIDCSDETGIKSYPYTHTNNFYAREVLEAIEPPYYTYIEKEDFEGKSNHVDYDFLDKIKDAGYKIYLNHNIDVSHLFLGRSNRDWHKKVGHHVQGGRYGFGV